MKKMLLSMLGLCIVDVVSAQVCIADVQFNPNGVTNEGLVVGSFGEDTLFMSWGAKIGTGAESVKAIGDQSSGQESAGGRARFLHDGKFVAAPTWIDEISVDTDWEGKELPDFAFKYTYIAYLPDMALLAVGTSKNGQCGEVSKSATTAMRGISCRVLPMVLPAL